MTPSVGDLMAAAICPVCGKEFTPPAKHHGGRPAIYCSLRCRDAKNRRAYLERLRAAGKTRPSRAKVREPRACAFCGKAFVAAATNPGAKYCSIACANRARAGSKPTTAPITAPTTDQAYEASLARVRAYLKLPASERWANRGMLTDTELRMAEQMWQNGHGSWNVRYNTLIH